MSNLDREKISELLSAYLDGEADPREKELVEHLLETDESVGKELEALRQTVAMVKGLPRHAAPSSVADDLRDQIERMALLGPQEPIPETSSRKGAPRGAWLSMAAMIGLVAVAGVWMLRNRESRSASTERLAQAEHHAATPQRSDKGAAGKHPAPAVEPGSRMVAPSEESEKKEVRTRDRVSSETLSRPTSQRRITREQSQVGALRDATAEKHVDAAPIGEKLASRADSSEFRKYRFANEPLSLRIGVADDARRKAALDALHTLMARKNVATLNEQQSRAANSAVLSKAFYYEGKPGVNYDGGGTQFLVRVASRDLPAIVDDLARVTQSKDISLKAGPLVFSGLERTRSTLHGAENQSFTTGGAEGEAARPAAQDADSHQPANGKEAGKSQPDVSPSIAEVLGLFGIKPEWVRVAAAPPEPQSDAERPTLVERGLQSIQEAPTSRTNAERPDSRKAQFSKKTSASPANEVAVSNREAGAEDYVTVVIEFFDPSEVHPAQAPEARDDSKPPPPAALTGPVHQ